MSILGLVNYFRDHVMVMLTWTAGRAAFKTLKKLVNACPKLYFIKKEYKIILYTDTSDYAHGAKCMSSYSSD